MYVFGFDIGGTSIKAGMFKNHKLVVSRSYSSKNKPYHLLLSDMSNFVKEMVNEYRISELDILGIGMGIPGIYYQNKVSCVNIDLNSETFINDFKSLLGFDTLIVIDNDANLAALAEAKEKNLQNILLITLGTGIGCGIVINGTIYHGSQNIAGEIGHIKVNNPYHFKCSCGKNDCLETLSSATGILRLLNIKDISSSNLTFSDSCADVFMKAQQGDLLANQILDESLSYLGNEIGNLVNILNPDVVILSGGMTKSNSFLIDKILPSYQNSLFRAKDTKITISSLNLEAGIYGAMWLVSYYGE